MANLVVHFEIHGRSRGLTASDAGDRKLPPQVLRETTSAQGWG